MLRTQAIRYASFQITSFCFLNDNEWVLFTKKKNNKQPHNPLVTKLAWTSALGFATQAEHICEVPQWLLVVTKWCSV